MNTTYYKIFSAAQFTNWYDNTLANFKFFAKLFQDISHSKRLNGVEVEVEDFLYNASNLKEKLGSFSCKCTLILRQVI
ncbi:DUF72 domain-containing protein [Bizionia gelidisalsuginis]|uniref:DUF72 domain-containing protein n=1 Tax=Bizionia gelidisalsuginis TaxID=291188 RepID=UPI001FE9936E|nr:DUF72 domain-containing protein [Bizionia gelidisalsuginis]